MFKFWFGHFVKLSFSPDVHIECVVFWIIFSGHSYIMNGTSISQRPSLLFLHCLASILYFWQPKFWNLYTRKTELPKNIPADWQRRGKRIRKTPTLSLALCSSSIIITQSSWARPRDCPICEPWCFGINGYRMLDFPAAQIKHVGNDKWKSASSKQYKHRFF